MELLSAVRDRRRSWWVFGSGFALGLIIAITLAIWAAIVYWPRPGPPGEVIVAPTPEEERHADLVLEARPAGEFAAVVTRPPMVAKVKKTKSPERGREPPPGGETTDASGETTAGPLGVGQSPPPDGETAVEASGEAAEPPEGDQGPSSGGETAEEMPAGWMVGDRLEAPMSGALKARVVDKRTGEELGTAEVAIAGTIEAYFAAPGRLELRGEFAAEPVTMAINSPPPAVNRIGLMYSSIGGLAAYYRHDWLLVKAARVDVLAWARVTIGQDVREIAAGIEAAF